MAYVYWGIDSGAKTVLIDTDRLVSIRTKRGLSQGRLGALIGRSQGSIGDYERLARRPTPAVLKRIADALGVTVKELTG